MHTLSKSPNRKLKIKSLRIKIASGSSRETGVVVVLDNNTLNPSFFIVNRLKTTNMFRLYSNSHGAFIFHLKHDDPSTGPVVDIAAIVNNQSTKNYIETLDITVLVHPSLDDGKPILTSFPIIHISDTDIETLEIISTNQKHSLLAEHVLSSYKINNCRIQKLIYLYDLTKFQSFQYKSRQLLDETIKIVYNNISIENSTIDLTNIKLISTRPKIKFYTTPVNHIFIPHCDINGWIYLNNVLIKKILIDQSVSQNTSEQIMFMEDINFLLFNQSNHDTPITMNISKTNIDTSV